MRRVALKIASGIFGLLILLLLDGWILGSLAALVLDMAHTFPPDLAGWRGAWLDQPLAASARMISPNSEDSPIRGLWLSMQPLLVAGLSFLGWHLWQWSRRPKKAPADASGYGSHGTARWMNPAERRRVLQDRGPGLLLGRTDGRWWRLHVGPDGTLNDFVILFGPSKSGKSSRYAIPNMIHEQSATIVATDPKGELFRKTAALKERQGYRVWVINLKNFAASMRYNPLSYCRNPQDVFTLAYTIVYNAAKSSGEEESLWLPAEQAYLSALALYILHERPPEEQHLASVLCLATTIARDPVHMDGIFDALAPGHPALQSYNIFRLAADADKMRSGIVTGAAVKLRLWAIPELAEMTAMNDFDIRELGRERTVLYLILPDDTAAFAPLTSLLFTQIMQELYREADAKGGRLPVHVRLRLDEAANVGRFPEFAAKVATMRSRGLSPEIILQDLGQLQRLYPDSWSTILANCDVQVVMGCNDQVTAEYLSKRLGTQTIRTASTSHSEAPRGGVSLESRTYTGRPLMFPGETMAMPRGEMLVCLAGNPPLKLHKVDFSEHPDAPGMEERDPNQFQPPPRGAMVVTDPQRLVSKVSQPVPKAPPPEDGLEFLDKTRR